MTQLHQNSNNPVAFKHLMRVGQVAYAEGNHKHAHDSWQQAAMMQPDNEEVRLALLRVLHNDDDRRVCLRNILTINPHNKRAQEMLDELIGDTQSPHQPIKPDVSPKKSRYSLGSFVLRILESVFIGTLIAIGMLIVRFLLF
jgi:uncharacterized protein with FMN-binding domain